MKKFLSALLFIITVAGTAQAQAPDAINYQAVARNAAGVALPNQNIALKISILSGSASGPVLYSERQTATTNQFGLFTLQVGRGQAITGTFGSINWEDANQWMQVELDPTGGTSYFLMGTSELLSVPYSFYAGRAGTVDLYLNDLLDVNTVGVQPGQVIKYNGLTNQWEPASAGGTYYAGNGISINNDTISDIIWDLNGTNATRNGPVGIGTSTIHPSAILELSSTTQGFLPPRMTTVQRDNISSPAAGLTIFNTTDSVMQYYNGQCWLAVFQENCDDCLFELELSDTLGIITRTTTDTTGVDITLNQTGGNPMAMNLFLVHNLPAGATATLTQTSIFASGTSHLTVYSDVFAQPGTYPIAVQAVCGNRVRVKVFKVVIDSCYHVTLTSAQTNYNLATAAGLPSNIPICVVVDVMPGVEVHSANTAQPAFTEGTLNALSHVGIRNNGAIIGKGGNGGAGGSFSTYGDPGLPGGNALDLTVRTSVQADNGYFLGGGGGGGSVAIEILSIPFLGTLTIGAGGGGGAELGNGGTSTLPIMYDPGQNGGAGVNGNGGSGGVLNVPVSIPLVGATVTVTPNAVGGDGGGYGMTGGTGIIFVNIQVSVPIFGTIFNQNFPNPPIVNVPAGGLPGNAIKRNGNPLNFVPDGNYQTTYIRGQIGN